MTTASIKTPRETTGRSIVTFYRERLSNWRCHVTESTPLRDSFILECERGRSRINVNTDNLDSPRHFYEITVDADGPPD